MISFLTGKLVAKAAPVLVLDVNGIGYEVQASLNTFAAMPVIGEPVQLLTHFVVREDAQLLYGFANASERTLFKTIIKVNKVGPKLALAILSGMEVNQFAKCVLSNDVKSLTRLPGVGKKTAERLIVEMKDRLKEWHDEPLEGRLHSHAEGLSSQSVLVADAEAALIALGYKPVEASKSIASLALENYTSSEDIIRAALQAMISR